MKVVLNEKGRKNLPKEFLDALEELKLSAKNTKEKVDKVKAIGKKYDIPKELVDDEIARVLKAQGFTRWTIKRQINGSNMHHIDSKKVPEQARAKSIQKTNRVESEITDLISEGLGVGVKGIVVEDDSKEIWQIKPSQYNIKDVQKYDRPFLIAVVQYQHAELKRLSAK